MRLILLFCLTISFNLLFGQTYTEIASANGMGFPFGNSQFEGGGGISFADFNQDGRDDLTFCTELGVFATAFLNINRLYQNNGSFVFTDVTAASGLPTSAPYKDHGTYGASFGDYDNDGWLDLYISNYGEGPASSLYP